MGVESGNVLDQVGGGEGKIVRHDPHGLRSLRALELLIHL